MLKKIQAFDYFFIIKSYFVTVWVVKSQLYENIWNRNSNDCITCQRVPSESSSEIKFKKIPKKVFQNHHTPKKLVLDKQYLRTPLIRRAFHITQWLQKGAQKSPSQMLVKDIAHYFSVEGRLMRWQLKLHLSKNTFFKRTKNSSRHVKKLN